jgi:transposase
MAKHSPRAYPPEFRRKVVTLARDGRTLNSLANEFGVARQTIMNWLKQEDLDAGRRDDGLTTEERHELTRLRRENKRLKLEAEILSKAAAWFARETNAIPEKSSDS